MKKILIIGKRSLIGNRVATFLKKSYEITHISFHNFKRLSKIKCSQLDYVINFSINKKYITKEYNKNYDNDLYIAKKIKFLKVTQIMLSTRKVYQNIINRKENSKILPIGFYGCNKFISEKNCSKIKKNFLILRVSNVLVDFKHKYTRLHKTFLDIFLENLQSKSFVIKKNDFKDFITINQFNKILDLIITKKVSRGLFNVSLGKKVFIRDIISWLAKFNKKPYTVKFVQNSDLECFTLNNNKISKKLNVKLQIKDVKEFCYSLSRNYFKK